MSGGGKGEDGIASRDRVSGSCVSRGPGALRGDCIQPSGTYLGLWAARHRVIVVCRGFGGVEPLKSMHTP